MWNNRAEKTFYFDNLKIECAFSLLHICNKHLLLVGIATEEKDSDGRTTTEYKLEKGKTDSSILKLSFCTTKTQQNPDAHKKSFTPPWEFIHTAVKTFFDRSGNTLQPQWKVQPTAAW